MAWLGLAWFGLAWFGLIWLGLAWFELPEATKYQDCKKVSRTLSSLLLSWSIFRLLLLLPAPYPCAPLQFSGFHEVLFFAILADLRPLARMAKNKNSGRRSFFLFLLSWPPARPFLTNLLTYCPSPGSDPQKPPNTGIAKTKI